MKSDWIMFDVPDRSQKQLWFCSLDIILRHYRDERIIIYQAVTLTRRIITNWEDRYGLSLSSVILKPFGGFRPHPSLEVLVSSCPGYGLATKGRVDRVYVHLSPLGKQKDFVPNRMRAVLRDE